MSAPDSSSLDLKNKGACNMTLVSSCTWTPARLVAALMVMLGLSAPAAAQTLERIQTAGTITLGYEADARPFSYAGETGAPAGYAVRLCEIVADQVREQLSLTDLKVDWVPVKTADRLSAVTSGQVDLFCGAVPLTLSNRAEVSFSIPIFPNGIGGLVTSDTSRALVAMLTDQEAATRPIWRGAPARTFINEKTFAVIEGSSAAAWLEERIGTLHLSSRVLAVPDSAEAIQHVAERTADVFFGDVATVLAVANDGDNLKVLPRYFTHEPAAFALSRGDEDFRLAVDRALSLAFRSDRFNAAFVEYFGEPAEILTVFFDHIALPD